MSDISHGDFPIELRRPLIPNGCRRAPWHDYRSRCIYMITLNAAPGMPPFSSLQGIPGHHDFPPRAAATPVGEIISSNISALKAAFPFISILRRVIMPEHIHFVIFVKEASDIHLGEIIRHLKKSCTSEYLHSAAQGNIPDKASVFDEKYHDRILMKEGQLERMLSYVSDNPRRRMMRMMNPGFHLRRRIRHQNGKEYEIYGNPDLLSDPDLEPVKISSKYSPQELVARELCWKHTVENCGVLVSPFISEAERSVYKWAVGNGGRIIHIVDNGFGTRYTPKGLSHRLCSEGRLLLIAPMEHSLTRVKLTRSDCEMMNHLASDVASGKVTPI